MTSHDLSMALHDLDAYGPADELRRLGIEGVPGDCHHCPVANWLARRFELPAENVRVNAYAEIVWPSDDSSSLFLLPAGVARFVYDFDLLAYPDLVAKEEETC